MLKALGIAFGFIVNFGAGIFFTYGYLLESFNANPAQAIALIALAMGGFVYGCIYEWPAGVMAAIAIFAFMVIATFEQTGQLFAFIVSFMLFICFFLATLTLGSIGHHTVNGIK